MADYNDLDMIYTTTIATSSITDIVSTNVFNALKIPKDTGQNTINFYAEVNFDGGQEVFNRSISYNCRSNVEKTSKDLALLAFDLYNRHYKLYSGDNYYCIVTILPTIPPLDDADVYNTPISIKVRRR